MENIHDLIGQLEWDREVSFLSVCVVVLFSLYVLNSDIITLL